MFALRNIRHVLVFTLLSAAWPPASPAPFPGDSCPLYAGVALHYGFVIPHHSFIEYLLTSHIRSAEVIMGLKLNDSLYYQPRQGIGFFYSELGNQEILGRSFSLFGYSEYHLFHSPNEKLRGDFRIGIGLGYVTRIFDIQENNMNMAISAHLNAHIHLGFQCTYAVTPLSSVSAGVRLSHLSNGKIKSPNTGLNLFTLYAMYSLQLTKFPAEKKNKCRQPTPHSWMYEGVLAGGTTVIDAHTPGRYGVFMTNLTIFRQYHARYRAGLGMDIFYNQAYYPWLNSNNMYDWQPAVHYPRNVNFSGGIHCAHEVCHHRLVYTVQMGVYLRSAMYGTGGLYHRIGIKYTLSPSWAINLTLKSHWAVAEYIEWGMAYRISQKK